MSIHWLVEFGRIMVLDLYDRMRGFKSETPNKFTLAMGELIRKARVEARITQKELAERIYHRQATISDIESGKREASSMDLFYLSHVLKKPITYFYSHYYPDRLDNNVLTLLEQELLLNAKHLDEGDLKKIIAQIKAINDLEQP